MCSPSMYLALIVAATSISETKLYTCVDTEHGNCSSEGGLLCDYNYYGPGCSLSCTNERNVPGHCTNNGHFVCINENHYGFDCSVTCVKGLSYYTCRLDPLSKNITDLHRFVTIFIQITNNTYASPECILFLRNRGSFLGGFGCSASNQQIGFHIANWTRSDEVAIYIQTKTHGNEIHLTTLLGNCNPDLNVSTALMHIDSVGNLISFQSWIYYTDLDDVRLCSPTFAQQPHGTCNTGTGWHCYPGWTGKYCSEDINECDTQSNCVHGNCTNNNGSYSCECHGGWKGVNCDQDIDECDSNPCLFGKCININGSFFCNKTATLTAASSYDSVELRSISYSLLYPQIVQTASLLNNFPTDSYKDVFQETVPMSSMEFFSSFIPITSSKNNLVTQINALKSASNSSTELNVVENNSTLLSPKSLEQSFRNSIKERCENTAELTILSESIYTSTHWILSSKPTEQHKSPHPLISPTKSGFSLTTLLIPNAEKSSTTTHYEQLSKPNSVFPLYMTDIVTSFDLPSEILSSPNVHSICSFCINNKESVSVDATKVDTVNLNISETESTLKDLSIQSSTYDINESKSFMISNVYHLEINTQSNEVRSTTVGDLLNTLSLTKTLSKIETSTLTTLQTITSEALQFQTKGSHAYRPEELTGSLPTVKTRDSISTTILTIVEQKETSVKVWVKENMFMVLGICIGVTIVLVAVVIVLVLRRKRHKTKQTEPIFVPFPNRRLTLVLEPNDELPPEYQHVTSHSNPVYNAMILESTNQGKVFNHSKSKEIDSHYC